MENWTDFEKIVFKELIQIKTDIAGLKVKSGVWGLVGGAVPIVMGLIIWYIKTNI